MKTLENQTLLYDKDCPLCQAYTSGFIKTGMLDKQGKKPYSDLSEEEQTFVDIKRAANEIALVDNKNKTVLYGIDSLLRVIGNSFPFIEKIGKSKLVNYLLKKMYSFVSYNRKVIIPNKEEKGTFLKCVPDFNYRYRLLYILFATTITVATLYNYSKHIAILPEANITREILLALGQIVFQFLFIYKLDKQTKLNYVGNLMTVSLIGSLLLLPILIANSFIKIHEMAILSWFAFTVLIMFTEHFRRLKILNLSGYLSLTWVIYRAIALYIILTS